MMSLDQDVHKHYEPEQYSTSFRRFQHKCKEGYNLLRSIINECYTAEPIMREYWLDKFQEELHKHEEFMDNDCLTMYQNIYIEAKKQYHISLLEM